MKKLFDQSYYLFYLFYFIAMGAYFNYLNVFLEARGLTGSQLGLISSSGTLISVFIVPLWGIIGDKTRKYKMILLTTLSVSLIMTFFYARAYTYLTLILCAIILTVFNSGIMPLSDVLAMNYCAKEKKNYGTIRSMGSIGWVVGSFLMGGIAEKMGFDPAVMYTYGGLLMITLFVAFLLPQTKSEEKEVEEKKKLNIMDVIKNKAVLFLILINLLSFVAMDGNNYNANHIINTLGGTAIFVSYFTAIQALPEVLVLTQAKKLFDKFGFKKIYIIALLSIVIRLAVYSFTSNLWLYVGVSIINCLAIIASTFGNLEYLRRTSDPSIYGTTVTFFNASKSLGTAVFAYVFGVLYEYAGSFMIYRVVLVTSIAALLLVVVSNQFNEIDHLG